MKIFTAALTTALLFGAGSAFAQASTEIELTRTVLQTEKKVIVAKNLGLTETEGQGFWPVYNEYQGKLSEVNTRMITLIRSFSEKYESMTEEQADEMLKELMSIQEARLKERKSYLKKFQKVLPPKQVVRYYQIENRFQAIIDYEVVGAVPLIR